jgi:hypothetical protein
MIPFKINGSKYQIPTDWNDVSFKQYVRLLILPDTLLHKIHLFTGIDIDLLQKAKFNNLEKINLALSFINLQPKLDGKPSAMVGPYYLPKDPTVESLGQFEDLRALVLRIPKELKTVEDHLKLADLYLEACAIYCQKVRDGEYDSGKVPKMKEQLENYSCTEIINTGSFFLFKPLNISINTTNHSQNLTQRMKKLLQDFPGYQKSLDFLLRSSKSQNKQA